MKCQLPIAEKSTGIVLGIDGKHWIRGKSDPFIRFDDLEQAVLFAREYRAQYPENECIITDEDQSELQVF